MVTASIRQAPLDAGYAASRQGSAQPRRVPELVRPRRENRTRRTRLAHRRRLRGMRHAAGGQVRGAATRSASRAKTPTCPRKRVRRKLPFPGRFSARKSLRAWKRPAIGTSHASRREHAADRPFLGTSGEWFVGRDGQGSRRAALHARRATRRCSPARSPRSAMGLLARLCFSSLGCASVRFAVLLRAPPCFCALGCASARSAALRRAQAGSVLPVRL